MSEFSPKKSKHKKHKRKLSEVDEYQEMNKFENGPDTPLESTFLENDVEPDEPTTSKKPQKSIVRSNQIKSSPDDFYKYVQVL